MLDQSLAIYEKACKTGKSTQTEYMLPIFTSMANMLKCKAFQQITLNITISSITVFKSSNGVFG